MHMNYLFSVNKIIVLCNFNLDPSCLHLRGMEKSMLIVHFVKEFDLCYDFDADSINFEVVSITSSLSYVQLVQAVRITCLPSLQSAISLVRNFALNW